MEAFQTPRNLSHFPPMVSHPEEVVLEFHLPRSVGQPRFEFLHSLPALQTSLHLLQLKTVGSDSMGKSLNPQFYRCLMLDPMLDPMLISDSQFHYHENHSHHQAQSLMFLL